MFLSTNSSLQSISASPSYHLEVNEKEFLQTFILGKLLFLQIWKVYFHNYYKKDKTTRNLSKMRDE